MSRPDNTTTNPGPRVVERTPEQPKVRPSPPVSIAALRVVSQSLQALARKLAGVDPVHPAAAAWLAFADELAVVDAMTDEELLRRSAELSSAGIEIPKE